MTDLAGNHPDMIAQVKQDFVSASEQTVSNWDVARFEQILAQETAAINPVNSKDTAVTMSLDKLFETIGLVDVNKQSTLKSFQNLVNEAVDKNSHLKTLMNGENATGKSLDENERFEIVVNQMNEMSLSQTKVTQASIQHMSALAKSKWVKSIAEAAVNSVKNTITRT